ncbi:hypothetical protein ACSBR2_010133 [Camellia fascicularis]
MVPGMKTRWCKKTATDPITSPSGTFAHVIVTPQTLSDETQPPGDTQTFVEETQKRSKAGKANRSLLPYNYTSGSHSFPIAMSLKVDENGELNFSEFYLKSHKSKKTNEWIDPKCGELHDAMVNLQAIATAAGILSTQEELSRQVLGQRKNYLCGFGIGPRPYSPSDSAAQYCDKQMEAM